MSAGHFNEMFDWDGYLLKLVYFYGFLVGVSNFEIDWSACRVFKSKRSTIFAATHNVLALILLIYYPKVIIKFGSFFVERNSLHMIVIFLMSGLIIASGK